MSASGIFWRTSSEKAGRTARLQGRRSSAVDRSFDRLERGLGLRGVGPARLRHVGTAAAALATKRLGTLLHEVDRIEALGEIAGDAHHDAGLAIAAHANDRDNPRANLLLALVGEAAQVLQVDAFNRARHQ